MLIVVSGSNDVDFVKIEYQIVEDVYVPATVFGICLIIVGIASLTGIIIITSVSQASKYHISNAIGKYT